jgi:hypothetical protein
MTEIIKVVLENANAISGLTVAILGIIALLFALLSDPPHLYSRGRYKDRDELCTKQSVALEVAHAELNKVNILLTRLQVEKEYGWRPQPTAVRGRIKKR